MSYQNLTQITRRTDKIEHWTLLQQLLFSFKELFKISDWVPCLIKGGGWGSPVSP